MIKFYQEALSESVKVLLNSEAQLKQYITQLGSLKVQNLAEQIVGKEYPIDSLLKSYKTYRGEYENTSYRAVHVDMSASNWDLVNKVRDNETLLSISVTFVRDPDAIFNSKLKLTDSEKKLLKKIKRYYSVKSGINYNWVTGSEIEKLGNELSALKHNLCTVISLSWHYSLEKFLSDKFLTTGIKAEKSLMYNHDNL